MSTMAVVLHKHVRGGGVRLCMMAALVQDGRAVCPGYAAVEYVQVRCRSRHQHHGAETVLGDTLQGSGQ